MASPNLLTKVLTGPYIIPQPDEGGANEAKDDTIIIFPLPLARKSFTKYLVR